MCTDVWSDTLVWEYKKIDQDSQSNDGNLTKEKTVQHLENTQEEK
jgi:hypothetical protein